MVFNFSKSKRFLNNVKLTGIITETPIQVILEDFDGKKCNHIKTTIAVQRKSGYMDEIVVVAKESIDNALSIKKGNIVSIIGYKNSKNEYVNGKRKLLIYVSAKIIEIQDEEYLNIENNTNPNIIELEGFICKPPVFRQTPQGRFITDAMLAINRPYPSTKTDYIPLICWGGVAERMAEVTVGSKIRVKGRIQSREYEKKIVENEETIIEKKVAYEVSVNEFNLII